MSISRAKGLIVMICVKALLLVKSDFPSAKLSIKIVDHCWNGTNVGKRKYLE